MNDSRFVDIASSLIKGAARPLTIVSEDSDRTQSKTFKVKNMLYTHKFNYILKDTF